MMSTILESYDKYPSIMITLEHCDSEEGNNERDLNSKEEEYDGLEGGLHDSDREASGSTR